MSSDLEVEIPAEVQLAEPVPRTTIRGARRQITILWHAIIAWAFAPGWVTKILLTALSLGLIVYPLLKAGLWKHTAAYGGVWLLVGFWKAYRELTPKNMQLVQRQYLERKLMLFRLIRDLERAQTLGPAEVKRFQEEVLQLIANYVRAHRCDLGGTKIYANLLVDDGPTRLRIIARDRVHRESSWTLEKKWSLAWVALKTGTPKITGDVYADYPETPAGKPYRSILVLPVMRGDRVLGAVSIDSSRRYHFDRAMKELVDYLSPYVALLAWTLDPPWGKPSEPSSSRGGGTQ